MNQKLIFQQTNKFSQSSSYGLIISQRERKTKTNSRKMEINTQHTHINEKNKEFQRIFQPKKILVDTIQKVEKNPMNRLLPLRRFQNFFYLYIDG